MSKMVVSSTNAPQAVGPYSQAVSAHGVVYCSGQIPIDPATGELIQGSIAEQTARCMENLSAVLEAAGSALVHMVKVNAYLIDINDFAEFNEAYEAFVGSEPPARATFAVAALPKGARVEVDCIALVD